MKKKLLIFLVVVLMFTGCGNSTEQEQEKEPATGDVKNENKITCTLSKSSTQYEINSTYTIYYNGNYVEYVHSLEYVFSSNSSILNETYTSTKESYKKLDDKYGGYDYNVTKTNNKVVSDVKLYFSKIDLQKYVSDYPSLSKYIRNGKILADGLKSYYLSIGANCE